MTWLIKLYPPAFRRRYGRELAELITAQPASFGMAIDLVAAAIDAWINPRSWAAAAATHGKGAAPMVTRMLQLKCAGEGAEVTRADNIKSAAVMLGGTLIAVVALTWAVDRYGNNAYLTGLLSVSWLIAFIFSEHFTSLKGRPWYVQTILIGGQSAIVLFLVLGAVWLNSN
jgi:hypothetical protein